MRSPGDILLVSCYELGHQPFALASSIAALEEAGYHPRAVDTSVEELTASDVRSAKLVAISVPMHTALRLGVRLAARIARLNPEAHVSFYGLYALLNASYLFRNHASSVIGGEYEQPLLELARALERGAPCDGLPGVRTPSNPAGPWLQKVRFSVPRREPLPPLRRYSHLVWDGEARAAGYVEASRGCLHTCRHCPITPVYHGRFFVVPREVVLEDVRRQVAMGARHITFGDPDFLNGPGHSLRILRAMHEEFPDLTFDATIKIEHILERRHIFPELRELGCAFVLSAVESLSDTVLARLDKGHTRADVIEAIRITSDAGIPLRPSLLPFTPWETLDGYAEILEFFELEGMVEHVDPVQFSIRLLVPPGSAIADELASDGLLGELDEAAYTYRWAHPDPRMDELQREVAATVERAAQEGAPAGEVFQEIKRLAWAARGEPLLAGAGRLPAQPAPPRLTEPWFC